MCRVHMMRLSAQWQLHIYHVGCWGVVYAVMMGRDFSLSKNGETIANSDGEFGKEQSTVFLLGDDDQ